MRHTSQEIVNNVPYFGIVHNLWATKVQYSKILVRRVCSISKGGLRDDKVVEDLEESSGSETEEEPQTLKRSMETCRMRVLLEMLMEFCVS